MPAEGPRIRAPRRALLPLPARTLGLLPGEVTADERHCSEGSWGH